MDRRTFLKQSAGVGLGAFCIAEASRAADTMLRRLDRVGVQLYSLRSLMEQSVPRTLAQVSAIGYDEVEFAGYYDHSPHEIRTLLDGHNLTSPATHVGLEALQDNFEELADAASIIGHDYLVCPSLGRRYRSSLDGYREVAGVFNRLGRQCRDVGLQFAYHNHGFEFEPENGTVPYDVLLQETDPGLVEMELDLFWAMSAGADPVDYFQQYPDRFSLCHVKDMTTGGDMTSVGNGAIDFAEIFSHADDAGLVHYIVEHDNPEHPLRSIGDSYNYLQDLDV